MKFLSILLASVLLNGFIGPNEWSGARKLDLGRGYSLLVKQDRRFVYLAVAFPRETRHSGIELYVADESGQLASYHISSALGRRVRSGDAWSAYEWQPKSWSGNIVQMIVEEGKTKVLGVDAFEFQFERANFKGKRLRLRVELRRPAAVFPESSAETDPANWLQF